MDSQDNNIRERLITYVAFIYLLAYIFSSYSNMTYVNKSEIESNKIMIYHEDGVHFKTR